MAKRPLKLSIYIPAYNRTRNDWRRLIHAEVIKSQRKSPVRYEAGDRLEVQCRLYLNTWALAHHDVDNRLKDILDALQGRAGGPKNKRTLAAIIPNDRQIYRVIIEKFPCQEGSDGWGVVTIRRLPSANIRWQKARQLFAKANACE
jgi:Holliday junction resolvase RusA-like endonuclease